ncbi:uncharacterized protein LOC132741305 [Ruditapes philippinarum]|uniref:uncharacterized protein LOC132741305 n=1 Tax=Ruditapes philippinarum TaxID=129788 RepID=UPI00295B76BD|nr:uncharacterized protein LOC132741305 [Ruditapes philippinarum]
MYFNTAIIFILSLGHALGEYQCKYLDQFEKTRSIVCETGCCGDIHLAYCCHRYLPGIIIGSVGGIIFLAVLVVVIHIYYRRCRRQGYSNMVEETRNYGAIERTMS